MSENITNTARAESETPSRGMSALAYTAAAGLAAAAVVAAPRAARAQTKPTFTFAQIPGTGDVKVLNYALALEALEADLYSQAYQRLTDGQTATATTAFGSANTLRQNITGLNLPANDPVVNYTRIFGIVEAEHRNFLNGALAANSIIGTGSNGVLRTARFDFGIANLSRDQILSLLYAIEDTGVKAYLGAIPSFATKTFLAAAGGIQATEARHTAVLAIIANQLGVSTGSGTPPTPTAPLVTATTPNTGNPVASGIDDISLRPDQVLAAVSGPNGYIVIPSTDS